MIVSLPAVILIVSVVIEISPAPVLSSALIIPWPAWSMVRVPPSVVIIPFVLSKLAPAELKFPPFVVIAEFM